MACSIRAILIAVSCGLALGARKKTNGYSIANITDFSCDSYCRSQRKGRGKIIGTAPSCGGECNECSGSCRIVTKKTGMSDYGAGCWSGDKVCCCELAEPPIQQVTGQDGISVMSFNTYLLEVNVIFQVNSKPNLESRAKSIADWFTTIEFAAIPDVLVLNEIFSFAAEDMLKTLCSEVWQKNWRSGLAKFIPCNQHSHFAYATMAANPTAPATATKCGGVVVLVKKGHRIIKAEDQTFKDSIGTDSMANKGFWAVKMEKGTQQYWIIGTHVQAHIEGKGPKSIAVRLSQFAEMRQYVDANIGSGQRVVYAGDMNTFTHAIPSEDVNKAEIEGMLQAFGAPGAPAIAGSLIPNGFWLPLDTPLYTTADVHKNHYIHHIPEEKELGSHQYDWILVPGPGDRLTTPKSARYQYAPVKSDKCLVSELTGDITLTDDLSDHYAVVAEFCYGTDCTPLKPVVGHRGYGPKLPDKPFCPKSASSQPLKPTSCHELCKFMSLGGGSIIGTSPTCGGSCNEDCPSGFCQVVSTKAGFTDYGQGCWSGDKVCCCWA